MFRSTALPGVQATVPSVQIILNMETLIRAVMAFSIGESAATLEMPLML